jgi:hypothetical protein
MAEEGLPEANHRWNMENISALIEKSKGDIYQPSPLYDVPAYCLLLLLLLPKKFSLLHSFNGQ